MLNQNSLRKRADALMIGQSKILEMISRGKSTMPDILDAIIHFTEDICPDVRATILYVIDNHLYHGAAPSMPEKYTEVINGMEVGPEAGSCGTAAYRKERVIVENVAIDPLWSKFSQLGMEYDFSACWSEPIFAVSGEVLGTFALYRSKPGIPIDFEIQLIEISASLASIAIERNHAEKELRTSEKRYRILVENAPVCIHEIDMSGKIISMNKVGLDMVGVESEEMIIGNVYIEAVCTKDRKRIQELLNKAYAGKALQFEFIGTEDLKAHIFSSSFIPLRNDDGKVVRIMGVSQDITEAKRVSDKLKDSEKKSRAWLECSPACTKIIDLDFNLQYMSSAGIQGLKIKDINTFYGKPYPFDFYPEKSKNGMIKKLKKVVDTNKVATIEDSVLDLDGNVLWFHSTLVPVSDDSGKIDYIIVVSIEITERKKAEYEREHLIKELEQKNAELERFAYTVSHDLKSPLITISGFLGLLEKNLDEKNHSIVADDIKQIREAAFRMQDLLDDLLELSRVGRVIGQREEISLEEVFEEVSQLVSNSTQEKNVDIKVEGELSVVYGDYPRIVEVAQNLVENAIKFMGNQKNPKIRYGMKNSNGTQCVYVKDNGIGINPQFQDKIFDLFDRLDPSVEGTGIGLTISKRIIEVHGGEIWVESEGENQGSTFCFTLPFKKGDVI